MTDTRDKRTGNDTAWTMTAIQTAAETATPVTPSVSCRAQTNHWVRFAHTDGRCVLLTLTIDGGTLSPTSQTVVTLDERPLTTKEINWVPTRALVNLAAERLIVRHDPVPRPAGRPDPKNKEWIDHLAQVVAEAEFLGQAVTTLLMDRYLDGDRNQAHIWMRRLRRSALTRLTEQADQ